MDPVPLRKVFDELCDLVVGIHPPPRGDEGGWVWGRHWQHIAGGVARLRALLACGVAPASRSAEADRLLVELRRTSDEIHERYRLDGFSPERFANWWDESQAANDALPFAIDEQDDRRLTRLRDDLWRIVDRPVQTTADEDGPPVESAPAPSGFDAFLARVAGVGDGELARVRDALADERLTVDQRLRELSRLDPRVCEWESADLARILACDSSSVRKSEWWRFARPQHAARRERDA